MGASWLLVRTDLRRRWPTVVALMLFVGLAGTFVLTAATGARRADSALERFLAATKMWDGSIEVDFLAAEEVVADVAAQPEVAATSAAVGIPLVSEEIETGVIAGLAPGWLREVYRPRILAGRLPDPSRADELLVNEEEAERHHLVPGDVVILEDFLDLGIAQSMTIVGIHRGVIDLALGDTFPGAIASEAFGRRFGDKLYAVVADTPDAGLVRPQIVARMHDHVADPVAVLEAVAERHGAARPRVADRGPFVTPIERALAVQVEAFWILTATSGLSALLLLGMAVARLAMGGTHSDETLRALGFGSMPRLLATVAVPALVVLVGCALALAGAAVASPLVPLGSARLVEPDPGIWVDPATSLIGGLVLGAGLVLIAAILVRLDRHGEQLKLRGSRSAFQGSLRVTLGRDLAFRGSSWGRLALLATGIGLALVVSASVYTASLDRLINSPSLFGSDYDVVLFPADEAEPGHEFGHIDLDDPTIEAAAVARVAQVEVAGDTLEALVIDRVRGSAGGTVLRGRAPQGDEEVALGPATAKRLALETGDEMTITGARERPMRIVGETVLPLMGQGAYGDVMWLTPGAAERLGVEPYEPRLLLKLADGVTQDDLGAAIGDGGDAVPLPDDVSNLDGVGQIPLALAIFGALLSGAVLALALVGIVRRRRHDLAILRTLGLRPRQIRGSVLAAALLMVVPGAVIGIAGGVVLGRAYWSTVSAAVPAVAQPVVPLAMTVLVVLGALTGGCLLAAGPARLTTWIRPAEILERD